mgnify:CR=1 FL=1|jgi:hypothetical protein
MYELAVCCQSVKKLQGLFHKDVVLRTVELCLVESDKVQAEQYPEIQQLLLMFADVFDEPKGLPPSHPFDHSIPILPRGSTC